MKNNNSQKYALIYNRVSSTQQETEGSGLISQEQRCIKYAESKGYVVEKERIFHDTFSGGGDFMRRPAMRELLEYIDENPHKNFVVVFDDLKRFARDTKFHIELRSAFNVRKAQVECLNFNFEDTPEGNFVETILAAQNQLEREQNRRQVIQKQKSRLESGYWAFHAPLGYTMKKVFGFMGKVPTVNEKGLILKEALEGYANLKFIYLVDVAKFLKDNNIFRNAKVEKYINTVKSILLNPFYAGYVEYEPWGVEKRKGVHEALISEDIYRKNIERLNKPVHASRVRKDDNPEFELRRLINCIHCNNPLTGSFSKGRTELYPYYLCQKRGCPMYRKSIARDILEKDFESEIKALKPTNEVIETFRELFEECWGETLANLGKDKIGDEDKIKNLENEIKKYTDLAGSAKSDIVRFQYEDKIEAFAKEVEILKQKSHLAIDFSVPYQTALDKVIATAKSPYESWASLELLEKKKMFYFFFDGNILYDVRTSYRTAKPSVLYRVFNDLKKNSINVEMARIELACK
ncbi:MAG: Resolvase-like protein [Candidatus Nomurabacteria bacterium GW2011_GWB1_37_5]|uniref:Resolvase-like protein n=1 Tax=Candidatus Nomurabacteria bacterium GW2011_GWB1_37_5 TaxID=1618742 RepID=A0A0G0JCY7_9BACT|nr:MAG: Resolvase-like protein [Candidatus Nomurabacteria bacterium GW2011_GWB1_37_5]